MKVETDDNISILNSTISKLELLPGADVQTMKEQVLADLAISRKQVEYGEYQDLDVGIEKIRKKYGLQTSSHT